MVVLTTLLLAVHCNILPAINACWNFQTQTLSKRAAKREEILSWRSIVLPSWAFLWSLLFCYHHGHCFSKSLSDAKNDQNGNDSADKSNDDQSDNGKAYNYNNNNIRKHVKK